MPLSTSGRYRFVPLPGFHHVVMMLVAGSVVLTSVLSAGCTSEGMRNVFLAKFSYYENGVTPSENKIAAALASAVENSTQLLEVRVGFLGICAKLPADTWACSTSFESISKQLALVQDGASNTSYDPLGVIDLAKGFRDNVVFDGLMESLTSTRFISVAFSVLSFLLLSTFPGWHKDDDSETSSDDIKPFPSRPRSQSILFLLGISVVMTLLSIFWQHIASSNAAILMKLVTAGVVQVEVGAVATGLGWATLVLNVIEFIAILVMILSLIVLARLAD